MVRCALNDFLIAGRSPYSSGSITYIVSRGNTANGAVNTYYYRKTSL